jgi:hypothetical protein
LISRSAISDIGVIINLDYHLRYSLQAASPETFGYTFVFQVANKCLYIPWNFLSHTHSAD